MSAPGLSHADWAVRAAAYRGFVERLEAPSLEELAAALDASVDAVLASLERLEDAHHIALLPDRSGLWMASPFSAVPTDFPVETPRGRCWANCAWDALGVPAILGNDGWTETRCAESGERLSFGVQGGRRVGDEGLVHLVVPPRDAWVDIGFT